MNILYVSSFVYRKNSSAAIRNNKLVEGLIELGHSVDVFTIDPGEEWTDKDLWDNHEKIGVSVKIFDVYSKNRNDKIGKKNRIKKILPKAIYSIIKNLIAFPDADKNWLKKDLYVQNEYDLIISSSDTKTSHFVASEILKQSKLKSKWVQVWGDPWETDVNLDLISKKIVGFFERKILRQADKVFYVSELTAREYVSIYPDFGDKIRYVGRSYYKKLIVDFDTLNEKEISIFYPGSLNANRDIVDFCESIKEYNRTDNRIIKLNICGHQSDDVIKRYAKYDFVFFMGVKTIDEVYENFNNSHFLLFIDNGVASTQIPGKLFDYYGTNLPILALITNGNESLKDYLANDGRTMMLERDSAFDMSTIFEFPFTNEVKGSLSPRNVAMRFLNEL